MIAWSILLCVVLLVLIIVLVCSFVKGTQTFLYLITIAMALLLLLVEIIMLGKSLDEQHWIILVNMAVTVIVGIVLGIALLTDGNNGHKSRRQVRVETVVNDRTKSRTKSRPQRTGHRASRGRATRAGNHASYTRRRGR